MVQLKIGASLFNKRAIASTASDSPVISNNANGKFAPKGAEEAFPHVILPIKFAPQRHVNMCGDACVNMLYEYRGKKAPNNLKVNSRGVMQGMDTGDIAKKFGAQGDGTLSRWRPAWRESNENLDGLTEMRLAHGLKTCGPLMWSGEFARFLGARWGHWIIVHGVVDETVMIADPWHGQDRRKPFSWLKKHMSKDADDLPFYVL